MQASGFVRTENWLSSACLDKGCIWKTIFVWVLRERNARP